MFGVSLENRWEWTNEQNAYQKGYHFCYCFLGNLYDRVYYSAVPDFIDLNYNGYHWFVFNVADIFITIGVFALIFFELLKKNEK